MIFASAPVIEHLSIGRAVRGRDASTLTHAPDRAIDFFDKDRHICERYGYKLVISIRSNATPGARRKQPAAAHRRTTNPSFFIFKAAMLGLRGMPTMRRFSDYSERRCAFAPLRRQPWRSPHMFTALTSMFVTRVSANLRPKPLRSSVRTFAALGAIAAIAAFALAPARVRAEDAGRAQHVLRIGYQKSGLLAILKAQGSLDAKLKPLGYSVKWFEFPAGPQLLEALNANSIDFGYTGAPPPVFAQAAGVDFVYVGAEPGGQHNEALIVKADSPLHTPADLKGKRIALQKGSSSNFLLLEILKKAGLRYEDIHPVYLAPADARAAFESGDVDAWVIWDPYYASAQQALKARTLSDYTGLGLTNNFYEATRGFAQQHADVVEAVLAQLRSTGAWVNAHPSDTAALLAPSLGLDRGLVETWVRRVPYGTSAVTADIVRGQQSVADAFYEAHLIPQKLTVSTNVPALRQAAASTPAVPSANLAAK